MKMKKLLGVFLALSLLGGLSTAQAVSSVWLEPVYQEAPTGTTITLTLKMDFDVLTLGGGVDVFYDATMLDFVSFVFNPAFMGPVADPFFSHGGDDFVGEVNDILSAAFTPFTGAHTIGTLTFNTLSTTGLTSLLLADNDTPGGPWIDATTGAVIPVDYTGKGIAEVLVTPLPAAAWLMMAGLGFLVGFGRRKMGVSA